MIFIRRQYSPLVQNMSTRRKKVRFKSANVERNKSLSDALTLQHLETKNSGTRLAQTKKKKRKQTKLQTLKAERRELQNDLKSTKEWILDDNKRKASPSYTSYENRQRLARTASDTISKLQRLEGKILAKEKSSKQKTQKTLTAKLRKTAIKSDKQHVRLIKMTEKLERMKLGEVELRAEIARREVTDRTKTGDLSSPAQNPLQFPRIKSADLVQWVNISSSRPENKLDAAEQVASPRPTSVLTDYAVQLSPGEKRLVADKLAHKYDMTRELRNTIHEHMINRSYSFSYFNIIPPYKRKKPKPQKTKQVFNRLVYEDKVGVMDFGKTHRPTKVVLRS